MRTMGAPLLALVLLCAIALPARASWFFPERQPYPQGLIPCRTTSGVSHACLVIGMEGPGHQVGETGGRRVGKACAYNILRLFAWGDMRVRTDMVGDRIEKISSVDYETFSMMPIWGIFTVHCTVVKGGR